MRNLTGKLLTIRFGALFILLREEVHLSDFRFPDGIHYKPYQGVGEDDKAGHYQYGN